MIGNRTSIIFSLFIAGFILPDFCLSTWNFASVGLPNDVPIWRFAVWRNRAFFALPIFLRREKNINGKLTLLEAGWPEPGQNSSVFFPSIVDKSVRVFSRTSGVVKTCDELSSVVGLDVDVRGRLWILDSPEENNCPAKIIVFDLRRNDLEIARTDLRGITKKKLRTLVIDSHFGIWGPRAYIGDPGDESIIVYSLLKNRWWRLRLVRGNGVPNFGVTEIAISRKDSLLYFTDHRSENLFSVDLGFSRKVDGSSIIMENDSALNTTIKWEGTKMGISSGIACDYKDGLHYFLVTEHASVRWDTKNDLKTTSHSILLQNENVPCITDYRVDAHRNVWGLVNLEHPFAKSRSSIFHGKWDGESRTVRIIKYYPV